MSPADLASLEDTLDVLSNLKAIGAPRVRRPSRLSAAEGSACRRDALLAGGRVDRRYGSREERDGRVRDVTKDAA